MSLWPEGKELRTAANGTAPCQRALADDWASVLSHRDGKAHLLAHAPTGLGKTLAALAPALAWVAERPDRRRVYYLVNRVAQHENPLRELRDGLAARFEALDWAAVAGGGHRQPTSALRPPTCADVDPDMPSCPRSG